MAQQLWQQEEMTQAAAMQVAMTNFGDQHVVPPAHVDKKCKKTRPGFKERQRQGRNKKATVLPKLVSYVVKKSRPDEEKESKQGDLVMFESNTAADEGRDSGYIQAMCNQWVSLVEAMSATDKKFEENISWLDMPVRVGPEFSRVPCADGQPDETAMGTPGDTILPEAEVQLQFWGEPSNALHKPTHAAQCSGEVIPAVVAEATAEPGAPSVVQAFAKTKDEMLTKDTMESPAEAEGTGSVGLLALFLLQGWSFMLVVFLLQKVQFCVYARVFG